MSDRDTMMQIERAMCIEIDRQCGIGAGMAQTEDGTGLFCVNADLDTNSIARAILAALRPQPDAGEWRMVPVEPTEAMLEAIAPGNAGFDPTRDYERSMWRVALAAAPTPPASDAQDAFRAAARGHGVALRRKDDPPIPGEPFMSMADAAEVHAKLVASGVYST